MTNELKATIEKVKAKYQAQIRQLTERIKALDDLSANLDVIEPTPIQPDKYAGWKVTQALLDAVQTIGLNGGATAAALRKHITANGYRHSGKYFGSTSLLTLKRLARTGRITSEGTGEERVYKPKM